MPSPPPSANGSRHGARPVWLDSVAEQASRADQAALARPRGSGRWPITCAASWASMGFGPASCVNSPRRHLYRAGPPGGGDQRLPLTLLRPRPLDEAISSAGGVRFEALDHNLMLDGLPGVFCAGGNARLGGAHWRLPVDRLLRQRARGRTQRAGLVARQALETGTPAPRYLPDGRFFGLPAAPAPKPGALRTALTVGALLSDNCPSGSCRACRRSSRPWFLRPPVSSAPRRRVRSA